MPTRRRFLQHTTGVAALAALGPLLPNLSWAADSGGLLRRRIPSSGELLPAIGLGTSRTHDVPLDEAHLAPLREVMATLIGGGASLVDTAPSYGRAEAVCGALAAGARDRLFLASKVSSSGREAGLRQIEASFADLGTERIDLLQVHNLQDTETQPKLLRELKEQGKVRYIGVTHYLDAAHERLLEVLRREPLDFVQFNYSIGERNAERELLPFCADKGIAVLINRPFQRAALFDKVRGKDLPEWARAELDAGSWAQLMLKYILANPAVTAVIPATSKARYMADNLQAGHGRLPDEGQRRRIVELFA
ncbi:MULTISPECIES: aldo/keto reductase [unclassified Pseudomonas]|uniref:aldo/keto reductase n=1 Tax=unclassified Pseudomonas TaxID=196821 RepID=UPI0024477396|nr:MULTISPECIES: aldo/keto reductase [unclassified Pseudomonas]MDG9927693.1 aldo/keto reductase [Pseudomonas sp. GD04042]MDH0483955.1 aldo/keto reductase [Pseudomonas sp. GD04015]MDH0603925.1 aldo/keto reductase [Pseudomonas sp. GD03869]